MMGAPPFVMLSDGVARPHLNIGPVISMIVVDDHALFIEIHYRVPISPSAPLHVKVPGIAFPQLDVRPIPILVSVDSNAKSRILVNLEKAVVQEEQLATLLRAFPELQVLAVGESVVVYRQAVSRISAKTELLAKVHRATMHAEHGARDIHLTFGAVK